MTRLPIPAGTHGPLRERSSAQPKQTQTPRRPLARKTPLRRTRPIPRRTAGTRPQARKTTLMGQADRLARAVVLRRAGADLDAKLRPIPLTGRCEHCGAVPRDGDPLQWCHVFTRRRYVLRWAPDGARAMLASCHRRFTSDPEAWRAYLVADLGEQGYADLYQRSQQTMGGSITVRFYRSLIAALTAQLKGGAPDGDEALGLPASQGASGVKAVPTSRTEAGE